MMKLFQKGRQELVTDRSIRRPHRISRATDSNAHVCALQGRGIIDAIASHAHRIAQLAQRLHDQELVVREDLRIQACLLSRKSVWVLGLGT